MTAADRVRSREATFTAWVLLAAGALLFLVTFGVDWLKGSGWALGPIQKAGLALGATSVLLGLAFLRLPLARRVAVRLWPFGDDPPVPPLHILTFALWLGALSGLVEAMIVYVRFQQGWSWGTFNPHALWMVPLVNAATLTAVAIPLAVFSWRGLPHLGAPRFAAFALLPLAVGAPLSLFKTELRWISVFLLTLGIAFQGSRFLASRRRGTGAWVRRSAIPLAAVLALAAVAPAARQAWSERRALAVMPEPPADAPNVLLIILDTVRAQNLSLYGYGRRTTPRLEELARRGTTFERAYAPSSWTLPSHGSFFTGRPPHQQSGNSFTPLDDALPTLAEALRDRGYYTLGIVANSDNAFPNTGLNRGFLLYDAHTTAFWEMPQTSRIGQLWRWGLRRFGIDLPTRKEAAVVNERLLDRLGRAGGRPFFAFLNYYDAHYPFGPPLPSEASIEGWAENPVRIVGGMKPEIVADVDDYDREIAYLDDRLGALFSDLARRGLLEKTVLIVSSDHGEEFAEHGLMGHGYNVYNTTLHVPLIVSLPGTVPEGVRIDRPVGLQDLPATVMQLAGLTAGSPFNGPGLLAPGVDAPGAPVLSEVAVQRPGIKTPARWNFRSLVWGDLHYILNKEDAEEVYDLRNDPWETRNLNAGGSHPRLAEFRSALSGLIVEDLRVPGGEPEGE
jgi:arylsulfatase A-like enzyme